MNITVFGASGAIGQLVTQLALDHGDFVTAYVRNPQKISLKHPNLSLVQGDLSNTSTIEKAVAESDVVISTLGPASDMSRKLKSTPIADGHERIIKAMNKLNKKRLITLATPALQSDDDKKNISTILPGVLAKVFLPNGYAEMKKLEGMIKESKLNWTVVRIINPNVKYKGQSYDYSFGDKPAKLGVSRENVAKFMYSAARDNALIRKMPIIYNK
ncbi:Putative NADH-flavin reductase [Paenibacillus polysaccharolyticus]|uniref:NAD(P)H-binding protein n=2 Tax=Paenibacillus TaxID=44249 RepID=A0ABS7KLM6_9BACL|nr:MULTISPECIES: NAD(P)H-binding protein [Paenibacillus]MBY0205058.1 NAD(P)H-binding protein [Paenibacillus cucumis (ex Kampfer et al. 2016)]SCY10474.1 Putative NADH-flavin reductase [Paenibacillus polysaccharolyticus]